MCFFCNVHLWCQVSRTLLQYFQRYRLFSLSANRREKKEPLTLMESRNTKILQFILSILQHIHKKCLNEILHCNGYKIRLTMKLTSRLPGSGVLAHRFTVQQLSHSIKMYRIWMWGNWNFSLDVRT